VTKPGTYDVALFADSPRLAICFPFTLAGAAPQPAAPRVTAIEPPAELAVGQPAHLRFALVDASGARRESTDLQALTLLAPGTWQQRSAPVARDDGNYELAFTPPQPGLYYVWIESESLGLTHRRKQFLIYEAK
jgi:hypothetical protein